MYECDLYTGSKKIIKYSFVNKQVVYKQPTLNSKNEQNPVKHLQRNFLAKMVASQMFDWVLNTPLKVLLLCLEASHQGCS